MDKDRSLRRAFQAVAATAEPPARPMSIEELEFKAEYFHNVIVARMKTGGKHYIDFHNNPMVTPPPLRDDGKTRCDNCVLGMSSYLMLPESTKDLRRELVLHIAPADEAWRNRG